MTYEEFIDSELRYELANISYDPHVGIVYGTANIGFQYKGISYYPGARVAFHLDGEDMRYRSV